MFFYHNSQVNCICSQCFSHACNFYQRSSGKHLSWSFFLPFFFAMPNWLAQLLILVPGPLSSRGYLGTHTDNGSSCGATYHLIPGYCRVSSARKYITNIERGRPPDDHLSLAKNAHRNFVESRRQLLPLLWGPFLGRFPLPPTAGPILKNGQKCGRKGWVFRSHCDN